MQAPVREIRTDSPSVFAFDIPGKVSEEDLATMASRMEAAFETQEEVSLLLLFEHYEGNELGALLDADVVRTHFKALSGLRRYAVVGAPAHMDAALKAVAAMLPIESKTFEKGETAEAWAFVGARPAAVAGAAPATA